MKRFVVEFQRLKTVRKSVVSQTRYCGGCGRQVDSISIAQAVSLFESDTESITRFLLTNSGHFESDGVAGFVCLPTLIAAMESGVGKKKIKFLGEKS